MPIFSTRRISTLRYVLLLSLALELWLSGHPAAQAQSITPAADGTGTIVTPNGNQLNIGGGSFSADQQNLFHSFQQFGLSQGQIANFMANPQLRNILGRVTGGSPSIIDGLIQVTGGSPNLFLMNPAGIVFGANASLNVPAAFTATTANGIGIGNQWFSTIGSNDYAALVGNPDTFAFTTAQAGAIINAGNLAVGTGQSLSLLGGTVINTGTLTAPGGQIVISAVPGENLVRVSQAGSVLSLEFQPLTSNVPNAATIAPPSLPELLTGGNLPSATGLTVENGVVRLTSTNTIIPGTAGTTIASGQLSTASDGIGGSVYLLGDRVALLAANINASGQTGGGTVLIGGDVHGTGIVPNAKFTVVDGLSTIQANALTTGNGGKVVVWADQTTRFNGTIQATGGTLSGNGGFAEVSGKQNLAFAGTVNLSAAQGLAGTLLLDPTDITIAAGAAGSGANDTQLADNQILFADGGAASYTISVGALYNSLLTTNTVLEASNDITWNAGATLDYNGIGLGKTLEFRANRNITFSGQITDSVAGGDSLNVIFNGDRDSMGGGFIVVGNGAVLTTNGGNLIFGGATNPATTSLNAGPSGTGIDIAGGLNTGAGNISILGRTFSTGVTYGVFLRPTSSITTTSGNVVIEGYSDETTGNGRGAWISGTGITTTSGSISLTGVSQGVSNVLVIAAPLTTGSGNITVVGTQTNVAGGSAAIGYGSTTTSSTGNISVTGTAVATATNAQGIQLNGNISTGGNITLTGSSNLATAATVGVNINGGTVASTGGGTVRVVADKIGIPGNISTTGIVQLQAQTNGRAIALGTGATDSATQLGLDQGELNRISSGNIQIGDATTGAVTFGTLFGTSPITIGGATTLTGSNQTRTWTLTGSTSGTLSGFPGAVSFNNVGGLIGGTANDTFQFGNGVTWGGTIDGGAGTDSLSYSAFTSPVTVNLAALGATNIESVIGSTLTTSTLVGLNSNNTWNITGAAAGNVGGINFSNFQALTGGTANDTFQVGNGVNFAGAIDGGAGTDTLNYSAFTSPLTVNLATLGATNLESITGTTNATSTLIGANTNSTWNITGVNTGDVDGVNFSNFQTLTGGSANDSFNLGATGSISGGINGGAGTNTVVGRDANSTWNITGASAGNVSGTNFSSIQALTGGTANDTFQFGDGVTFTGTINGGAGTDTLNYSAFTSPLTVNLAALGASNVESITGTTNATSTLIGTNTNSTWNITGTNTGTINGTTFSDFQALTGGTANDTFQFSDGAGVTGAIDGGLGVNSLNYSAYTTPVALNLQSNTATGSGSIANIQTAVGGSGSNTLTGTAGANTFNVTGANSGTLNGSFNFSAFQTLAGGAADDTVAFNGGSIGSIAGGSGNLTLVGDKIDYTGPVSGSGQLSIQTATAGRSIELGGTTNAGAVLDLTAAEIGQLQDGFSQITIGSSSTPIALLGSTTFLDSTTLQASTYTGSGGTLAIAGDLTINAAQAITTGDVTAAGQSISLTSGSTITTGTLNTSSATGSGGNITLNAVGDIQSNTINAQGATTGGNVSLTSGQLLRVTGTFTDQNGVVASISTAGATGGGAIALNHQGGNVGASFLVGNASTNGTAGSITSGSSTLVAPQAILNSATQGNIQVVNQSTPLAVPPQPSPSAPVLLPSGFSTALQGVKASDGLPPETKTAAIITPQDYTALYTDVQVDLGKVEGAFAAEFAQHLELTPAEVASAIATAADAGLNDGQSATSGTLLAANASQTGSPSGSLAQQASTQAQGGSTQNNAAMQGGSMQNRSTSGNAAQNGSTSGASQNGSTQNSSTSGRSSSGSLAQGGSTSGGSTQGGATSGNGTQNGGASNGATQRGATSGGSTSGNGTQNGSTSGNGTQNGGASNGTTQRGATSGGSASGNGTQNGSTSGNGTQNGGASNGTTQRGATSGGTTSSNGTQNGSTSGNGTQNGGASNGATQRGATSGGTTSSNGTQNGSTSGGTTQNGGASNGATQGGTTSGRSTSGNGTQNGSSPGNGTQNGSSPGNGTQNGSSSGNGTQNGSSSGNGTQNGSSSNSATQGGATSGGATSGNGTQNGDASNGATQRGATSGGVASGGTTQGDATSGNGTQNGGASGNGTQNGGAANGTTQGGATSGGATSGNGTQNGDASNGATQRGATSGGVASGGTTQGDATSGNGTQNGGASGNGTQNGGAANGTTQGGATSGGATSGNGTQNGATSGNGTQNGGASNGATQRGATSGGVASGGTTQGDATSGNGTQNGGASGNGTQNGDAANGTTQGGATSGGATSGNGTQNGATSGNGTQNGGASNGATQRGATSGGVASGGTTQGDATSGNGTQNGGASGNGTQNGDAANGTTQGGATSGGSTSGNGTQNGSSSGNGTQNGGASGDSAQQNGQSNGTANSNTNGDTASTSQRSPSSTGQDSGTSSTDGTIAAQDSSDRSSQSTSSNQDGSGGNGSNGNNGSDRDSKRTRNASQDGSLPGSLNQTANSDSSQDSGDSDQDDPKKIQTQKAQARLRAVMQATGVKPALLYVIFTPAAGSSLLKSDASGETAPPRRDDDKLVLVLVPPTGSAIGRQISGVTRGQVMTYVNSLRKEIISPRSNRYLPPAQKLYEWLIKPLDADLQAQKIQSLSLITEGGLRSLPVATLHDGKAFLIEKYSVALMPSLNLTDTRITNIRQTKMLAMGASTFPKETKLTNLPAVPTELSSIAGNLWAGESALNNDFTLANLKGKRAANPFGIIHLATHADFEPGKLSNSYIQLSNQRLRIDQIRELGWGGTSPVSLVVLSACRTALGNDEAELGFAGFAVKAGAQSALASLWYVSDEGTLGFMTEFYRQLKDASIKAEALRQTQLAMLRGQVRIEGGQLRGTRGGITLPTELTQKGEQKLLHPFFWGAFTLIGSPW